MKGCEENSSISQDIVRAELIEAMDKKAEKLSQVSKILAQKYGLSKNEVYEAALKLKAERSKDKE